MIGKKIYDPVHGFIRISSLEKELIDSYVFQRLHYIRQLGATYLVYPGATHTRFEHSLGVMEVATEIFDKITKTAVTMPLVYWRQIVRLAALCHDLGHLPFSHLAEKKILKEEGHEKWTIRAIESIFLQPIWEKIQKEFPDKSIIEDVIKTAIGENKLKNINSTWQTVSFSPWDRVMSQIISGDFFGADRIDYLLRDAKCTGVSYGLFDYHQLIETLRILPSIEGAKEDLTLGIEENGIESCEALLLARHFMHKRVYQHHSVQAYSFHMGQFMVKFYEKTNPLSSFKEYFSYTDNEILYELRKAFLDPEQENHLDALSLFIKENRYQAIEIPRDISQEELLKWKTSCQIQEKMIEFSPVISSKQKALLSFPVLKKGNIVEAQSCSQLFIPSFNPGWLYLSPTISLEAQKLLSALLEKQKG